VIGSITLRVKGVGNSFLSIVYPPDILPDILDPVRISKLLTKTIVIDER